LCALHQLAVFCIILDAEEGDATAVQDDNDIAIEWVSIVEYANVAGAIQ
jgi:hypothetical protein